MVCSAFDVVRSCYYAHRLRRRCVDTRRMALRSKVNQLFNQSRGSAGSRSILGMLREDGISIGRFRVRRLMRELGLVSKQPGSHAYKQATVERPDIPNRLNREFTTERPNQVWCGDITYIWAQGRWHYLAAVLDLHTRRVIGWALSAKPDAELVIKALDMAYEQRGKPQQVLFHSDQGSQYASRLFRQRYPNVTLDESRMIVNSTRFTTAGAALAHVDLALRIIRGRSPALAALVARYLLVEARSSQAEFVIPDHLAHADPMVERFECWARSRLAKGFSLAEAASAAGTSERTLARRLQSVLGKTPLSYFQDLRVEHAVHLLRTGNASVDQVAAQVGYSDGATLRALLRRKLGRGVRELRRGG